MARLAAEFIGTLMLVLFGCGAAVLAGDEVGQLGISLSFGFAIVALAYGLGPLSGGHVNPAVSLAVFLAGRMSLVDMLSYWAAQFAGALAGAGVLAAIAGSTAQLGQNGWGPEYSMAAAALFEVVMTALFVIVILGATEPSAANPAAGLAIGLTLAAIHIVGIQVTGVSVNPARSFGPAVLAGGTALSQLWLFFVAPAAGAVLGSMLFRLGLLKPAAPRGERIDVPQPAPSSGPAA